MNFSHRTIAVASVAVILAATLAFLAGATTGEVGKRVAKRHVVHIRGMLFHPARLEVSPGDAVEWVNDDVFLHAIKSADSKTPWQSKDLPPHASWTKRFDAGGNYLCPYHPTMTGEIVVTRDSATP